MNTISTENRYLFERNQLDITLRMLKLEARTRTIRLCTGLSNDRIRRIYSSYRDDVAINHRPDQRGKTACCTDIFTCDIEHQLESTTMCLLLIALDLMSIDAQLRVTANRFENLELGKRFCLAFECYRKIYVAPKLSFEHAWLLFNDLCKNETLALSDCRHCHTLSIRSMLAFCAEIDCPICCLAEAPA